MAVRFHFTDNKIGEVAATFVRPIPEDDNWLEAYNLDSNSAVVRIALAHKDHVDYAEIY